MQWSAQAEGKQKNELAQKELHKNNKNNKGRQLQDVLRLDISVALQQKTANFMQWRVVTLTEEKRKNQLAA